MSPCSHVVGVHFRLDLRIDAHRARHQVLVLRVPRLLLGNHAAVDLFLQQRMVAGDLLERLAAQAVEAGVADVPDRHLVVVPQRHHQRRAHAGVLRLALRRLVDRGVGALARARRSASRRSLPFRSSGLLLGERLLHLGPDQLHRDAARHLAGVVAAHAVGQHRQPDLRRRRRCCPRCASAPCPDAWRSRLRALSSG